MAVERPLDALNEAKGKWVTVELKNGRIFRGKLLAFDIHLNMALDEAEELEQGEVKRKIGRLFIRGDTVLVVLPGEA